MYHHAPRDDIYFSVSAPPHPAPLGDSKVQRNQLILAKHRHKQAHKEEEKEKDNNRKRLLRGTGNLGKHGPRARKLKLRALKPPFAKNQTALSFARQVQILLRCCALWVVSAKGWLRVHANPLFPNTFQSSRDPSAGWHHRRRRNGTATQY